MVKKLLTLAALTGVLLTNSAQAQTFAIASYNHECKLSEVGATCKIPLFFALTADGSSGIGLTPNCDISALSGATSSCNATVVEDSRGVYHIAANSTDFPAAGDYVVTSRGSEGVSSNLVVVNVKILPTASPVLTESCSNSNPGTHSLCSLVLNETSRTGTAQTVNKQSVRLASSESFAQNELRDNFALKIVKASGGAGEGQIRCICGNDGASTDWVYLCEPFDTQPTGTITYGIVSAPNCSHPRPLRRW